MKISDCEFLTQESATLKGFHALLYFLLWWTLHFWNRWLSPRWFFIEKEANIEVIVSSHSSSPCRLSPTSSWESATQFLGTTGNKSTDHLKWSCKNSPDLTFFLWKGAFPQGKHYNEILSAFRSFSLQSFSQRNLSGQTQISALQLPPCGLGHCFSQLLVYYFDAIVYASKWKDGKKSSCWVVLPGKEGLSSLSSRPSPSLPQVHDVSLFSVLLHNPLLGLTKLQGAVELSFHYLKGTNSVGQLPTLPISQSQP